MGQIIWKRSRFFNLAFCPINPFDLNLFCILDYEKSINTKFRIKINGGLYENVVKTFTHKFINASCKQKIKSKRA